MSDDELDVFSNLNKFLNGKNVQNYKIIKKFEIFIKMSTVKNI